jgi:hypothetical protein
MLHFESVWSNLCLGKRVTYRSSMESGCSIIEFADMHLVLGEWNGNATMVLQMLSDDTENRKFWEELIAYFPSYDMGHIENDVSNNSSNVACVFVTAVTILPSSCVATIGGFFTEPLPSNNREGIHRHTHTRARIHTHRETATWSHKPSLFFKIRKVG